ncbi:MAG: hypothetical protein IPL65_17500 [Lewinellaceae bacterium]|nr:hypothetical protein [Lewinellaceae bacterium]
MQLSNISKSQAYWWCQLLGWGAFMVYELVNYVGLGFFSFENALFLIFAALIGMLSTHAYRTAMVYWRVLEMSFIRMALLALLAVFVLSTVLFMALFVLTGAIKGQLNWAELSPITYSCRSSTGRVTCSSGY